MRAALAQAARAGWPLAVGAGLAAGLAIAVQPALGAAAGLGLAAAAVGVVYPPALVAMMFLGILVDRAGATGVDVDAIPITASKLTVLASLGLWGVHVALTRARAIRWHPVLSAMVGMVAVTAALTAYAGSLDNAKFTLFGLAMVTILVALVYAALAEAKLQPLYRVMALGMVAALALSVATGGGGETTEDGRSTGTMGDPNEWASMVLLLTPVLLGGLADDDSTLGRLLRLALVPLAPLAVILSMSRAALVTGILLSPACLYLLRGRKGEVLACGMAAALVAPLALDLDSALVRFYALIDRLQGRAVVQDVSLAERTELFRQGKQLFLDNWLIGAGPGNFEAATGFVGSSGELRPAHNTYLEVASEQGLVGLAAGAIFFLAVGFTLRSGLRDAQRPRDWNRVLGAAAGLGAFALMAATLGLLTFSMAYLVLGLALAVVHQAQTLAGDDG